MKKYTVMLISLLFSFVFHINGYAEPHNLTHLKQEIRTYHDSGAYNRELADVIHRAELYVDTAVKANQHARHPKKLAIVLDIDETSLSNYDKLVAHEFSMSHQQLHEHHLKAQTPVIEPMLSFYKHVTQEGVQVFFVTGRVESERLATEKNLHAAGFRHWAGLYLRPKTYKNPSAMPYKIKTRATITKLGVVIIASIGDQYSDLKGGYALKTFKLPNPYYYLP